MRHPAKPDVAQEEITYHNNIPATGSLDFYHSHDVYARHMAQPSLSSHTAQESTYTIGAGLYPAEPLAAPHGSSTHGYRPSDDDDDDDHDQSEAPSPESLASSPRSAATTPRSASRPATPRERVQQQIMLNQQKHRLRRQACSAQRPPGHLHV